MRNRSLITEWVPCRLEARPHCQRYTTCRLVGGIVRLLTCLPRCRPTIACQPMNSGSITHWIERVKTGSESVAEKELWDRYFLRLAALARRNLDDLPPQVRDDEDVALAR